MDRVFEATQQFLLDQCSDAIAIIDARRPGWPLLAANQTFRDLFASPTLNSDRWLDIVAMRVPDHDPRGAIRAAIGSGETTTWHAVTTLTAAGRATPDRWRWEFRPIRDAEGEAAQVALVMTRTPTPEANDSLDAIIDALPEGILIVDHEGRVEKANHAVWQLLGILASPRGQRFSELIGANPIKDESGEPCDPHAILLAPQQSGAQPRTVYLHLGDEGTVRAKRILAVTAAALPSRGAGGSTIVVMRDVSDQKREEAEKDSFLSLIAHEIKSPLTSIKGFSQLALRAIEVEADPLPRAARHLRVIEQQANRIGHLISDISDVSRLQRGILQLDPTLFDLVAVARTVAEQQAATIHSHKIIFDAPDTPLIVRADPRRVQQIAENLIANAAKYSPHADRVTVKIAVASAHARLAVEDSGIGISADDQARIFDRFYRTGGGTAAGLGLGLYIAHQVAALSGGALTVESTLGQGSTFRLDLPLAEPGADDD